MYPSGAISVMPVAPARSMFCASRRSLTLTPSVRDVVVEPLLGVVDKHELAVRREDPQLFQGDGENGRHRLTRHAQRVAGVTACR